MIAVFPVRAFADGGVELIGVFGVEDGQVDVDPTPYGDTWKFSLHFSKNVAYARDEADSALVTENLALVRLERVDGVPVGTYRVRAGGTMQERSLIYIDIYDWLEPLVEYRIVVEPGIRAANGEDVSDERFTLAFKAGPQLSNGMTVFGVASLICVGAFILVGLAVQCVRVRRWRR
jgi:hypothetical protein